LQDPGNVGTLIRSAVAFGFKDIYAVGGADPFSEKVIRSSAGTIFNARIHYCSFEDIKNNSSLIAENFLIADMDGENIDKIRLPKSKIAVIIGNEGNGVSEQFLKFANTKISIQMSPLVESLNAGVAGSIIMHKLKEIK
jgi:TrmH family RNA methyltransferase